MLRHSFAAAVAAVALSACAPSPLLKLQVDSVEQARTYASTIRAHFNAGGTEAQAIEKAKAVVAGSLKDPESARFRNVTVQDRDGSRVVCGEVNGKNSYGGYVGFRRFIAGTSAATIESTDSRYPDVDRAANAGLWEGCGA